MRNVNIGVIGFGTVGTGVVRILQENKDLLARRTGQKIEFIKVACRDIKKKRGVSLDLALLTNQWREVVDHPDVDIIVELIGGVHPAKEIVLAALDNHKHVVTANKALLAECGEELFLKASECRRNLCFEASVCGGIPIIKGLREGLVANQLKTLYGIVNGTSNYILSRMSQEGQSYDEALEEAQRKGYAEADPSLDVEGVDSAHKLAILASLAYGRWISLDRIYVEGISRINSEDIRYAQTFGYVVKLLAIAKDRGRSVEVRVHPTLISKNHVLASVSGVYNAIYYDGDFVGRGLMYGRGAGEGPTASSVVSDIVDVVRSLEGPRIDMAFLSRSVKKEITDMDDIECRCYLRFTALDKPGVLASIAGILGEYQISIASVLQNERHASGPVSVVVMTHQAEERNFRQAVEKIDELAVIKKKTLRIRVEDSEDGK